jgi:predicted transcriptional regulator of viral defense system
MTDDDENIETFKDFELSRLRSAKPQIEKLFNRLDRKVFKRMDISALFTEFKKPWKIPSDTRISTIEEFLLEDLPLREIIFESSYGKGERRFIWSNPTPYEVAASIKPKAYFSHGSAVFLHGFSNSVAQVVYLNQEQSPKPKAKGHLTQERLDQAFSNRQRQTNLKYNYEDYEIAIISGKNTKNLGVEETNYQKIPLNVTNLERTLVDITVRPAYSGGVFEVLKAFRKAKKSLSIDKLLAILKKLDYVYPYHQAIGFYMEKAGYPNEKLLKLLKLGIGLDFYLAHGITKNKKYDGRWRLFYPDGL